jgi:hypothetical protein
MQESLTANYSMLMTLVFIFTFAYKINKHINIS